MIMDTAVFEQATQMRENDFAPKYDEAGQQVYTVEEAFDKIDRKFIDFYGEYGRRMVNARREEWNKEKMWNFNLF
jgi:hypothetical protein